MATSTHSPASGLSRVARSLEVRMLGLAVLLAVCLSLLSPYFLTQNNIFNILDQSVVIGIVAVGMTFVILTGGIDLSVGSVAGLTGIVAGWPQDFDPQRALELGFVGDASFDEIIRIHIEDELQRAAG